MALLVVQSYDRFTKKPIKHGVISLIGCNDR